MLPRLHLVFAVSEPISIFLGALRAAGVEGDIAKSDAEREAFATDNSIYQLLPHAMIFPCGTADIQKAPGLLGRERSAASYSRRAAAAPGRTASCSPTG